MGVGVRVPRWPPLNNITLLNMMSSGQQSVWDDEEDWDAFKKSVGIYGKVEWDVYSPEARFAREYASEYKVKTNVLIALVNSRMAVYNAENKHKETLENLLSLYKLIQDLE